MHLAWLTAFLFLPLFSSKKRKNKREREKKTKQQTKPTNPQSHAGLARNLSLRTLTRSGAAQGYFVNVGLDNPSLTLSPARTLSKSSEDDGDWSGLAIVRI